MNLKPVGKPPTDAPQGLRPRRSANTASSTNSSPSRRSCCATPSGAAQETFWSKLDTSSLEKYEASCKPFRKQLDEEVIGKLPQPTEPLNPRTRQLYDEPKYRATK